MNRTIPVFGLLLTAIAAAAAPACNAQIDLDGRPCPCAPGWTCCPTGNVCVADGSKCPSTNDGLSHDDAGPDDVDADAGDGGVEQDGSLPLDPNATILAQASAGCLGIVGDRLYWEVPAHGVAPIFSIPRTGGVAEPVTLEATPGPWTGKVGQVGLRLQDGVCRMHLDGTKLVVPGGNAATISIIETAPDGATSRHGIQHSLPSESGIQLLTSITSDDSYYYFTAELDHKIGRIAKTVDPSSLVILPVEADNPRDIVAHSSSSSSRIAFTIRPTIALQAPSTSTAEPRLRSPSCQTSSRPSGVTIRSESPEASPLVQGRSTT